MEVDYFLLDEITIHKGTDVLDIKQEVSKVVCFIKISENSAIKPF